MIASMFFEFNQFCLFTRLSKLAFEFASLFSSEAVCTIAGPQGVGKSWFANILLELPEEALLVTGDYSCEHIPVLLKHCERNFNNPVAVFNSNNEKPELMSYEKARERVVNTMVGDLFAIWYVADCKLLQAVSPVMVLPGIERGASYNKHVEVAVANSDIIMIVVDSVRAAQGDLNDITNWIKEYRIPVTKTAIVGTKLDELITEKERNEFSKVVRDFQFQVFMVSNKAETREGHVKVWQWLINHLWKTNVEAMNPGLKKIIKDTRLLITTLEDGLKIPENTKTPQSIEIARIKEEFERLFKHQKDILKETFNRQISPMEKSQLDDLIKIEIINNFGNRLDLFFGGNTPGLRKILSVTDKIDGKYNSPEFIIEMYSSMADCLDNMFVGLGDRATEEEFCRALIAGIVTTDINEFKEEENISANLADEVGSKLTNLKKLLNIFSTEKVILDKNGNPVKVAVKNLGEALFTIKSGSNTMANLGKSAVGAAGVTQAGAEIAGGGFAGVTATALGITVGFAVAAVASHSLISSYRKGRKKLEFDLYNYFMEYNNALVTGIKIEFARKLDVLQRDLWFYIEPQLLKQFGITDKQITWRFLLSSIAELKRTHARIAGVIQI